MKIKTADLIGPALDWAVAKCESVEVEYINDGVTRCLLRYHHSPVYRPSVDWTISGPLIERERIEVGPTFSGTVWIANYSNKPIGKKGWSSGPTPLIATMRCFVESRLGDEVDVPEELLKWARTT